MLLRNCQASNKNPVSFMPDFTVFQFLQRYLSFHVQFVLSFSKVNLRPSSGRQVFLLTVNKHHVYLLFILFIILKTTLHKKMSHTTYVGAEAKNYIKIHLKI